jgi:hypothetical protein
MAEASCKDKMEFAYLMAKHAPNFPLAQLYKLMRYGSTLNRLAVQQSNDPKWCDVDELKRKRITRKISELVAEFGGTGVVFSNDPRGATVKIRVPDGYPNDWGREGICVPTS